MLRTGPETTAPSQPVELQVHGGVAPTGPSVAGKVLVITCAAPTVAPASVAGPECGGGPPRPNHCDDATGLTFTTGRTYLPAIAAKAGEDAHDAALSPDEALAELRTIADGLEAEVRAIADPIAAIDGVARALHDFPATYRLKPADVKAWARASIAGKSVALPADLRPEIAEELSTLLARVRSADAALRATPDRAAVLLEKVAARHARVQVLAAAAEANASATLARAGGSADERAAADARVAEVQTLQVDARRKLDAIRTNVTNLSATIMQALAKLGDAMS
jgi:hypothetical protein